MQSSNSYFSVFPGGKFTRPHHKVPLEVRAFYTDARGACVLSGVHKLRTYSDGRTAVATMAVQNSSRATVVLHSVDENVHGGMFDVHVGMLQGES